VLSGAETGLRRVDGYLTIEERGLIGDGTTAAPVGRGAAFYSGRDARRLRETGAASGG
jgi:hypothetical protein